MKKTPIENTIIGPALFFCILTLGTDPAWGLANDPQVEKKIEEEEESEKKVEEPVRLDPVIVTATRVEKPLVEIPAAVGVVEKEDIQLGRQQIGLDESLMKIPGLFMQNRYNFDQDLRISIRGFGARSGFGIRGIKIITNGIPESFPDGQAQVDSIDLGSTERIEVIRGPTSSLYGNASGGVISIITEDGPPEPFLDTRLSFGAYGFQKNQIKAGGQLGSMNYLVNLGRMKLDGYREHSQTESTLLNTKFRFDLDETSSLTTLVNFYDSPFSQDPGTLTREQVDTDPRQAREANVRFDVGEKVTQARLGLVYRKQWNPNQEFNASFYYTFRDFFKKLPFEGSGTTEFDRLVLGGGIKYIHTSRLSGRRNRLTIGVDMDYQNDDRRRFDNHQGQTGALTLNQAEQVRGVGPFIQNELNLRENLELTLGGRYDRLRFDVEDLFVINGDDSGDRNMGKFSPMVGLTYSRSPFVNLYGNISTSFETPTTAELFNPSGQGGFNPNIGPQKATNYEVGIKGSERKWSYELAVFTIRVLDELIPFELPESPGRTFYRNAGKSTRNGIELGGAFRPTGGLTLSAVYTYSDFFFDEFLTEDGIFNGNQIPGIPKNQTYGEVAYYHPSGAYGVWNVHFVGEFYVNNANSETNDAYTVSNLRLGYVGQFGNWEFSPFFGINNMFDESYNANVRINGFGGRYFEPAPGFNVYGGFSVGYMF